jgi:signal transduction histidine kinase/HPt (histidine-containing phosphotransfer) domain-containing protein
LRPKIITALVLACCALLLAWGVSRIAFTEMLNTVASISAPNERLRIVHKLAGNISAMDQLQKKQAISDPGNYDKFFEQSKQLRSVLDTLKALYGSDSIQQVRIASINALLTKRDKEFVNYLKVRAQLVNNGAITRQVKRVNALVAKNAAKIDSTVVTSEQKTLTTTVVPPEEDEDKRGFFGKIFKRKKTDEAKSFKIVNEENVKRDTVSVTNDIRIAKDVDRSLKAIQNTQALKSRAFINKEAQLANANTRLIGEMLNILRKVEGEAVNQIEQSSIKAKEVVNTGISRISIIMLVFLGITLVLLYLILTDISRTNRYRKALEAARDEAEFHGRAKQRFLSNMSHEIRTPLQSIIGYAELIKQQIYPQRKDIDAIYYSSEHLLQIVNEVLDYNRIVSGKFTFSEETFSLRQLLNEVVLILKPQTEKKNLKLKTDFQLGDIEFISGDPFRLRQILLNLMGNAIKFTSEGEVLLTVYFKRKGNDLHFTFIVKDTGVGFTQEEAVHIFGEFEQSETTAAMAKEGAGLGLAIVKALVDGQGGRIYAKSEKGLGSSFMVYLRFKYAVPPLVEKSLMPKLENGMEVWVIDDDKLILDLCSLILKRHNIKYKCFESPLAMLEAPLSAELQYILMDLRMPEMSGSELFKLMKPKLNPGVKVYSVTAQVLPQERAKLIELGFDGVVMKPFREHELLNLLGNGAQTALDQELPDISFNPSYLEKMTFGDEEQLFKILKRFNEDCLQDIKDLKQSMEINNVSQFSLLVHRLAGRIAQIGSAELAADFRKLEIDVMGQGNINPKLKAEAGRLIPGLHYLVDLVTDYSIS